nr:PAS domain-containing protein [Burkholderiaceae bacterium]
MRTWIESGLATRPWLSVTGFAVAYVAAALLGQVLASDRDPFVSVWPPAGLYLAALLLTPWPRWPLVLLGAALGNLGFDLAIAGRPLGLALGFWLTNTAGAVSAAGLIGFVLRDRFRLDDLRSMLALAGGGVVLLPLVTATLGSYLVQTATGVPIEDSFRTWLMADALGVLLVAPLLLSRRPQPRPGTLYGLSLEGLLWLILMALGCWLVFGGTASAMLMRPYMLLPLLLWAAIRFGVFGASVSITLLSLLSIGLTVRGYGPFGLGSDSTLRIAVLQPQLTIFGLTTLLVAVLFRQQQKALHDLRDANARLEQRVAERTEALALSETQARRQLDELEFIYANAPVGLGVLDRDLRFVRINERLAEINGLPVEAHIGYTMPEVLPGLAPTAEPLLREVIASGQPKLDIELTGETPAQPGVKRVWIEHWLPVRAADGHVVGINMVCTEVSEQRRMQAALRDSERRFRQFAERIDAVLWMNDLRSGRVLFVSPAYESIWGRPSAPLYESMDPWLEGVHPDDRDGVERAFFRDVAIGNYDVEYRVLRPDGTLRWVRDRGFPVHDDDGSLAYVAGIAEDITEDRRAREDLADSEQRFRLAARAAQGLVYEWDLRNQRVWRSEGLKQLVGYEPHEVPDTGEWWLSRLPPVDRERAAGGFAMIAASGDEVFEAEYRVQHRNGEWIDVWERTFIERDADGQPRRAIGHTIDVTARKRAELRTLASEERFRVAAEAVQGMVYDWDVPSDRVVRSDGLKTLLGFEPAEVPDRATWWRARMHPEDELRVYADLFAAAAAGQTRFECEFRIRHRDGYWVWVLDRSWLSADAQGRLTRTIGSSMNITERRRSEAALAALADAGRLLGQQLEAESAARTLVAAVVPRLADFAAVWLPRTGQAPVLVVRHTNRAREAEATEAAASEFPRMNETTPLGRALRGEAVLIERVADAPDSAMDERHTRVRERLGLRSSMLLPLTARDATLGVLALSLADSDEHAGRFYTAADLPIAMELARRGALAMDNAQLHQTTQRALAQLQVQDRRKTEFLSMLAHELRNPLTPIRNAAEVLGVLAQGQPQFQQIAGVLRRQTHKMARLVDDLLDMARITHGKVKLERSNVDLRDVVSQAADTLQQQAAAREQRIEVSVPETPVWVHGDALRLEQVLINLLSNACKFGDHADRIGFALTTEDEHEAIVTVTDHGTGITPALLPHVFDLFTQDERTPDRKHGGLGIGLALARSLVEMHGGQVNALSDGPGKGARFVVRLPLTRLTTPRPAPPPAPGATRDGPLRVLIAEDNVDAGDTLALLLRGTGYQVQLARSGPEALAVAAQFEPQVALLDIGLPGMDGFQVAARLRLAPRTAHILIAAISGYGDADSKRKAHAVGIDEYFVKPLDTFALL